LVAAKPADPQIDNRSPTGNGHIAKVPLVTAVERFRPGATYRAVCTRRFAANGDVHDLITQLYLLDNEPCARRQQQLWIHCPPCRWPSDPPGRRGLPEESGLLQLALPYLDMLSMANQPLGHPSRFTAHTVAKQLHGIRSRTRSHGPQRAGFEAATGQVSMTID